MPDTDDAPLSIENDHPSRTLPPDRVRTLVQRVLEGENAELAFLSVVLTDHATVRHLNREYLDHDYNTDVLSFSLRSPAEAGPAGDGEDAAGAEPGQPVVDGEVYVDLDTAAERHEEFGTSFADEAARYVVHGLLHLVGYDDATEADRTTMRDLEDRYLDAPANA